MERLKELRELKHMSLQQLSDKIGYSKQYLWNLEKGNNKNPSFDIMLKISEQLDVSLYHFTNDEKNKEFNLMYAGFKRLSEGEKTTIKDMISLFIKNSLYNEFLNNKQD